MLRRREVECVLDAVNMWAVSCKKLVISDLLASHFIINILNHMRSSTIQVLRACLLMLLVYCTVGSPLSIDFRSSRIGESVFWVRVQMAVVGGSAPYIYSYTHLPSGWKQVNHFLYIPIDHAASNRKYVCRLLVTDTNQHSLSTSLLFITYQRRVFVDGVAYPYHQSFSNIEPTGPTSFTTNTQPKVATATINLPNRPHSTRSSSSIVDAFSPSTASTSPSQQLSFTSNNEYTSSFGSEDAASFSKFESHSVSPSNVKSKQSSHSTNSTFNDLQHLKPTVQASEKVLNDQIQTLLTEVQQSTYTPRKTIDQIFYKLPTIQQLDSIILAVDILAISKTIQQVVISQLSCDQKIAYLSEFFGRIQANVELKKLSLVKLKLIGQLAEQQIKRLQEEVIRMENQIEGLNIMKLKEKLQQQVIRLENAYQNYNNAVIQNSLAERRLPKYEDQIKILQTDFHRQKQLVKTLKEKKKRQAEKIEKIKEELKKAEQQYEKILDEHERSQKKVDRLQNEIKTAFKEAKQTSEMIADAPEVLDRRKRKYLVQEVEVERIRSKIEQYSEKQIKLRGRIDERREEMKEESIKMKGKELEDGKQMIEALERNLPNIQDQMDELYYGCYEVEQMKKESEEGFYEVEPERYIEYLQKAYGLHEGEIFTRQQEDKEVLNLNHLTVYSAEWKQMYGQVMLVSEDDEEKQLKTGEQDFTCLRPSTVISKVGVIKYINKNLIIVFGDDGNIYKLYLGSCTRIQAAKSRIPLIGDKIVFKGNQEAPLQFNIYSVSSF